LSPRTEWLFEADLALDYRDGRDDVEDDAIDLLPSVDRSVELGGFVGATLPDLIRTDDSISAGSQL